MIVLNHTFDITAFLDNGFEKLYKYIYIVLWNIGHDTLQNQYFSFVLYSIHVSSFYIFSYSDTSSLFIYKSALSASQYL